MHQSDFSTPNQSELGKKSEYDSAYNPDKLFPIPRMINRKKIGVSSPLPFYGLDYWNHYEVSWLNEKGKPIVAIAEIIYGCDSLNIIESKSMKLYFNSFNNTQFKNTDIVIARIQHDVGARLGGASFLDVRVTPLDLFQEQQLVKGFDGMLIDDLDIECHCYHHEPDFLKTEDDFVEETLATNLLKSNCLVTNQPDWCSVQVKYKGKKINREGLLRYIVSFRDDNEFHEQCIEKIFMDIMQYCQPLDLTVYGRSTRRGGLDINAIRSTQPVSIDSVKNPRLCRQ